MVVTRPSGPPAEDLAAALEEFFVGSKDRYALQQDGGGYSSIKRPLTASVLEAHAAGQITVATYTTDGQGWSSVAMLDIDSKEPLAKELALFAMRWLEHWSVTAFLEPSGNKGYHIWALFKVRIPSSHVDMESFPDRIRELGEALAHAASAITGLADIIEESDRWRKLATTFNHHETQCQCHWVTQEKTR